MVTKSQALAAARTRYGATAYIEENRRAATADERGPLQARKQVMRDRVKQLDAEAKALDWKQAELIAAARFAVDVDGGPPSMEQLRTATQRAERFCAMLEERREIRADHDSLDSWSRRWSAGSISSMGGFRCKSERASADTLDELLAKIKGESA